MRGTLRVPTALAAVSLVACMAAFTGAATTDSFSSSEPTLLHLQQQVVDPAARELLGAILAQLKGKTEQQRQLVDAERALRAQATRMDEQARQIESMVARMQQEWELARLNPSPHVSRGLDQEVGARRRTQGSPRPNTTLVRLHHVTLDMHGRGGGLHRRTQTGVCAAGHQQATGGDGNRDSAGDDDGDGDGGGGGGQHRRTQTGSCGDVIARSQAVQTECCNEPTEDCSSGSPSSCNAGCARVFLPFMADCGSALGVVAAQYRAVVSMCRAAESSGSGGAGPSSATTVHQFSLVCNPGQVGNCIPLCDEHVRGDLLLLNIQGDDHKFSCERQHGIHSWIAPSADGGYLGDDFQAFFSAVVSGASGLYISTLAASLSISTDLTIRPGQSVQITGGASLPVAPTWGSGGFNIAERGLLSLTYLTLAGAISAAVGSGALDLDQCMLLPPAGGGAGTLRLNNAPTRITGTNFGGRSLSTSGGNVSVVGCCVSGAVSVSSGSTLTVEMSTGTLTTVTVIGSTFGIDAASAVTFGGSILLDNAGTVTLSGKTFAAGASLTVGGGTNCIVASCTVSTGTSITVGDQHISSRLTISSLALSARDLWAAVAQLNGALVLSRVSVTGNSAWGALTGSITSSVQGGWIYNPPNMPITQPGWISEQRWDSSGCREASSWALAHHFGCSTNANGRAYTLYLMPAQPSNYFSYDATGAQRYGNLCQAAGLHSVTTGADFSGEAYWHNRGPCTSFCAPYGCIPLTAGSSNALPDWICANTGWNNIAVHMYDHVGVTYAAGIMSYNAHLHPVCGIEL
jgi:hypothetical protein